MIPTPREAYSTRTTGRMAAHHNQEGKAVSSLRKVVLGGQEGCFSLVTPDEQGPTATISFNVTVTVALADLLGRSGFNGTRIGQDIAERLRCTVVGRYPEIERDSDTYTRLATQLTRMYHRRGTLYRRSKAYNYDEAQEIISSLVALGRKWLRLPQVQGDIRRDRQAIEALRHKNEVTIAEINGTPVDESGDYR